MIRNIQALRTLAAIGVVFYLVHTIAMEKIFGRLITRDLASEFATFPE